MIKLKDMTYLNGDGQRVTCSKTIQKEFGITYHNKVMRTIDSMIKVRLSNIEEIFINRGVATSGYTPTSTEKQAFIQELFIETTYIEKSNNQVYRKYEITEKGFYTLIGKIKSGRKDGIKKIDIIHSRFIDSFFELREEFNRLLKAYKILAEKFLPIDERGHISTVNGEERLYIVHSYYTTRKTRNEVTSEIEEAFTTLFNSEHKNIIAKEVLAHERNKPSNATPSKAYIGYLKDGEISVNTIESLQYEMDLKYREDWEL